MVNRWWARWKKANIGGNVIALQYKKVKGLKIVQAVHSFCKVSALLI